VSRPIGEAFQGGSSQFSRLSHRQRRSCLLIKFRALTSTAPLKLEFIIKKLSNFI
jgi:hypothetical protein